MRRFTSGRNSPKRSPKEKKETNMTLFYKGMKSPVGKLKRVASSKALVAVLWEQERPNRVKFDTMNLDPQHAILIEAKRQLSEYFAGKRIQFDLPLQPDGTESQKKVWQALIEIGPNRRAARKLRHIDLALGGSRSEHAFLQLEPARELRGQFNDSVDDHSYMSIDCDGVRFMILDRFFHIGKRLVANATRLCE